MNAPIDTGGPAFPCDELIGWQAEEQNPVYEKREGMTLRDYFIAHAPAEPWPEFNPAMPPKPTSPPLEPVGNDGEAPTDDELRSLLDWHNDPTWDAHIEYPKFSFWVNAWIDHWSAMRARSDEYAFQRRLQWPAYWADQMIAQRNKR